MLFMLSRTYLVMRLLTRLTKWRSEQAEIIAQIEGFDADTTFALKALMKEKPYLVLFFMAFFSSSVLGLAVRIFEMPFYEIEFDD